MWETKSFATGQANCFLQRKLFFLFDCPTPCIASGNRQPSRIPYPACISQGVVFPRPSSYSREKGEKETKTSAETVGVVFLPTRHVVGGNPPSGFASVYGRLVSAVLSMGNIYSGWEDAVYGRSLFHSVLFCIFGGVDGRPSTSSLTFFAPTNMVPLSRQFSSRLLLFFTLIFLSLM